MHSCAAGMLFLRVRGCGVDAPPFVFPRSESNVFSQAAMILTSRWRCGHQFDEQGVIEVFVLLLRGSLGDDA